jgi:D-alanyl-D-alanine dipeptidase
MRKILRKISWLRLVAIAVLICIAIACQPAPPSQKASSVPIMPESTSQPYEQSPGRSQIPNDALVDLQTVNSAIVLDIRYATTNNFMRRQLYPVSRCVLRFATAKALALVQIDLAQQDLGLKVYDCYRPLSVQRQMWQVLPDDRYVANPINGSRHNRGAAVDVTLVDRNGQELEMPTAYDDFTPKAHRDDTTASPQARQHSQLLATAMTKHGFTPLATEWWHFDGAGWQDFQVSDLSLQSLPSIQPIPKANPK